MILHIATTPPMAFYRSPTDIPLVQADLAYHALAEVGVIRYDDGENPTVTASVTNTGITHALGAQAELSQGEEALFSGVVRRVVMTPGNAEVTIEAADGGTPYTQRLNLRETTAWGAYRSQEVIPRVYGSMAVEPLEYSADRRTFVIADHALLGVDAVYRNQTPYHGYALRNGADSAGATVAFLDLADPLGDGEDLRAEVRAPPLTALGGVSIPDAVPLAGIIETQPTAQSVLRQIYRSLGRSWMPGTPAGSVDLYPTTPGATLLTVTNRDAESWSVTLDSQAVKTVMATYGYDSEQGDMRGAVTVAVNGRETGEVSIDAPWLVRARDALALAIRAAAWLGRNIAELELTLSLATPVYPGDWIEVDIDGCPASGALQVHRAEHDHDAGEQRLALRYAVGPEPVVTLTNVATGYYPVAPAGVAVTYGAGILRLTVTDAAGLPLTGADVTLDGVDTRRTDAGGGVVFAGVRRGAHQLLIERAGYASQLAEIVV